MKGQRDEEEEEGKLKIKMERTGGRDSNPRPLPTCGSRARGACCHPRATGATLARGLAAWRAARAANSHPSRPDEFTWMAFGAACRLACRFHVTDILDSPSIAFHGNRRPKQSAKRE